MSEKETRFSPDVPVVRVFTAGDAAGIGGNPAPVWLDADDLTTRQMQALAHASGHEAVFVCRPADDVHRWRMRYFVPAHEMEMCGHATIAALWMLHAHGRWDGSAVAIDTLGGTVTGRKAGHGIQISQPPASVEVLDDRFIDAIARCLGIARERIVGPVLNASTSRPKTLIRLRSPQDVQTLDIQAGLVEALCDRIGSTGLYPYAAVTEQGGGATYTARQFPKRSGYVEDPATGIAATALAWGLRHLGLVDGQARLVTIRQGEAMGSPSRIVVSLPAAGESGQPCWVGGDVVLDGTVHAARD